MVKETDKEFKILKQTTKFPYRTIPLCKPILSQITTLSITISPRAIGVPLPSGGEKGVLERLSGRESFFGVDDEQFDDEVFG